MPINETIGGPPEPVPPGPCEACGRHRPLKRDHCKTTGLYRGNICHGCNVTLPKYDDDPDRLHAAGHVALAAYIRRSAAYKKIVAEHLTKPDDEYQIARKDREGEKGICPGCGKRILKGEMYVPRIWKGCRGHDWHFEHRPWKSEVKHMSNELKALLLEVYKAINKWLEALDKEPMTDQGVSNYEAMVRARQIMQDEIK